MNKVINVSTKNNIKEFDALIVGGGGSGMRTSLAQVFYPDHSH